MINTRCPACGYETRVPDSIVGKKVRCKDPACQNVFLAVEHAEPVAASAPARDADLFRPAFPEPQWDAPEEEPLAAPVERKPKASRVNKALANRNYPNLELYLAWAAAFARIELALSLILAVFLLFWTGANTLNSDLPVQQAMYQILIAAFTAFVIAIIACIVYVITMAAIEFIHVIMDIESNTRRMAIQPASGGDD
jgi:hypothetical protein